MCPKARLGVPQLLPALRPGWGGWPRRQRRMMVHRGRGNGWRFQATIWGPGSSGWGHTREQHTCAGWALRLPCANTQCFFLSPPAPATQ